MRKVLVTGGCGFIGSHIVDALVQRGDEVVVLDDLSNGSYQNIAHHGQTVKFVQGQLQDDIALREALEGCEFVTHQAGLGSVPRSISDPLAAHSANATGTLNLLTHAKDMGVKRVVVASSSSIYGDTEVSPKHEGLPFRPKSPYALTKVATEEYARIFHSVYGFETIALRYFNVFGPRQTPHSQYAAVIPIFVSKLMEGVAPTIFGDGSTSRDFTYVTNVVNINLLAFEANSDACGRAYNVGARGQISLNELYAEICRALGTSLQPTYGPKRAGDVDHSCADISLAEKYLGFRPQIDFAEGIDRTVAWFRSELAHA